MALPNGQVSATVVLAVAVTALAKSQCCYCCSWQLFVTRSPAAAQLQLARSACLSAAKQRDTNTDHSSFLIAHPLFAMRVTIIHAQTQVYSSAALQQLSNESKDGSIQCPTTGRVFTMKQVRSVFII
jgi:hypothetical protein